MKSAHKHKYYPLVELTLARIREFYREPGAMFWVFVFPVLLAVGLGIAFRARPPQLPRIALETPAPQWLAQALHGDKTLEVIDLDAAQATRALRTGSVDLRISISPDDDKQLLYGYDPAREGAVLARLRSDVVIQRAAGRVDVISSVEQTHSETGGRYIDFLLPGLVGMNLMGSSMFGIGFAVVWDRKRQLLKRYAATPMRRSHYLFSFMFSRLLFMVAEVAALLLFGWLVFDVQVHGSVVGVGLIATLGSLSFAGLSLLIAARVQSVEAASGWMNFVQMPMWILSGAFFAYTRFPEVVQPFLRLLPATALIDALRAIINDGVALSATWPQMLTLGVWGLLSYSIALRIFRWQ